MCVHERVRLQNSWKEEKDTIVDEKYWEPSKHHGICEFLVSRIEKIFVLYFSNVFLLKFKELFDLRSWYFSSSVQFCHVKNQFVYLWLSIVVPEIFQTLFSILADLIERVHSWQAYNHEQKSPLVMFEHPPGNYICKQAPDCKICSESR